MMILFAKILNHKAQQFLSLLTVIVLNVVNIIALLKVLDSNTLVYQMGNWEAPFGITFVLDGLSVTMLLVTSLLSIGSLWYAIKSKVDGEGISFHVLFQLLIFGINGAFLTGDIFNLFVFFEVLLLSSYALALHGNGKKRVRFGLHYMIINLVGSVLFLFGIGAMYGVLGTLNIADMAVRVSELTPQNQGVVAASGLLLLLVFGLKAAMFPLYFWLPGTYSNTSAPVAAMFAIMTKVGIYSIIRVHGTIFGPLAGDLSYYYVPWVLGLGLITLILATIGIMSAKTLKEQVAYFVLASAATLQISIGINSTIAMSGAIYYLIQSTFIAGGFFLLADTIGTLRGEFKDKIVRSPKFKSIVFVGGLFFAYAIAISSMPPLAGFLGKTMILYGGLESPYMGVVFSVMIISSLLMIIALAKTGSLIFYDTQDSQESINITLPDKIYSPIIYLFSISFVLVLFANSVTNFTLKSSQEIFSTKEYISKVMQEKRDD
jgi:multicomponent K+:H+ antiporter subunit D